MDLVGRDAAAPSQDDVAIVSDGRNERRRRSDVDQHGRIRACAGRIGGADNKVIRADIRRQGSPAHPTSAGNREPVRTANFGEGQTGAVQIHGAAGKIGGIGLPSLDGRFHQWIGGVNSRQIWDQTHSHDNEV